MSCISLRSSLCDQLAIAIHPWMDPESSSSSRGLRTMFSEEQKRILQEAYEQGMNSVSKSHAKTIKNLANQINCDEAVIKVRMFGKA